MSEMPMREAASGATLGSSLGALLRTSATRSWTVEGEEQFCGLDAGPHSLPNLNTLLEEAPLPQGSIGWRAMG